MINEFIFFLNIKNDEKNGIGNVHRMCLNVVRIV